MESLGGLGSLIRTRSSDRVLFLSRSIDSTTQSLILFPLSRFEFFCRFWSWPWNIGYGETVSRAQQLSLLRHPFESQPHRKAFSQIAKGSLGKQLSG